MKTLILIAASLQLLLLSCSGQGSKQQPLHIQAADSIVIGFKDASVPPSAHKSYEMIFTPAKAQYRLYAYDSTLLLQDTSFSQDQFNELTTLFVQYQVKAGKPNGKTKGCTGGISRYVQGFTTGKKQLNGSVYYCNSISDGNIEGNLPALCRKQKNTFQKQ